MGLAGGLGDVRFECLLRSELRRKRAARSTRNLLRRDSKHVMRQPLEAKLRRLRELNAKAEKLKVDVNRLWRRFPPLPNSYVGVGLGVPEGDPQLTRTVTTNTTAPHEACKRLFPNCVPHIYSIYVDICECAALSTDTAVEGLSITLDPTEAGLDVGCDVGQLDLSTDTTFRSWVDTGYYRRLQGASGGCSFTGYGDAMAYRAPFVGTFDYTCRPTSSLVSHLEVELRCIRRNISVGGCSDSAIEYFITVNYMIGGADSGSASSYSAITCGEIDEGFNPLVDVCPFDWFPGCSPEPLAIGESRQLRSRPLSLQPRLWATLTRVA